MDTLSLLHHRTSQPKLVEPAPTGHVLDNILKSAVRVPDHGGLCPWKFVVCHGRGLEKLGEIYKKAVINSNKNEADIEKASKMPLRAPMVIVVIAKTTSHPKVPIVEQIESAACSVYAMELAAQAQGFGAMWRTGELATNEDVKQSFELNLEDEIVGFLYLGTPLNTPVPKPEKAWQNFVEFWD